MPYNILVSPIADNPELPQLKLIKDNALLEEVEDLIKTSQLRGEYELYNIYQDEMGGRYALVYASFLEQNLVSYKESQNLSEKEALYLHQELKKTGLNLDYLFIIPSYYHINTSNCTLNLNIIATDKFSNPIV